mmetsp:Transcript_45520/g.95566  ORF Transcript_45520/g.95566 Transcript_45520/m.95566 type:complete len:91 (+) Transcript_45520:61-333(+)
MTVLPFLKPVAKCSSIQLIIKKCSRHIVDTLHTPNCYTRTRTHEKMFCLHHYAMVPTICASSGGGFSCVILWGARAILSITGADPSPSDD